MSGKTLALVGAGIGVVIAVIGGFALLHDDSDGRPTTRVPGTIAPPTPGIKPTDLKPGTPTPPPPPPKAPPTSPPGTGQGSGTPNPPPKPPSPPPPPGINVVPPPVGPKVKEGKGGGPVIVVMGPDNQPVVGAIVEAATRRGPVAPRPTNKSGEAALDPIPAADGKVTGSVRHPRFDKPASFSCEPTAKRVEVRFTASATGTLIGYIHDARGQAPPAASLTVIDPNGGETVIPSAGFTAYDGTGRFKVELAPGKYSVKAGAQGFVDSELAYPTVTSGQESGNVDLLLEQGANISGKVNLPPELQSQRDPVTLTFDIEWVRGDMQNPTTTILHRSVQLAPDGTFVLEDLQSGMYRVRAGDGRRLTNWAAAKLDEGSRVNTTPLTFDAGPAIPPIRGVVRDSSGGVVAGALVKTRVAQSITDAGGGFELRGLDAGQRHDMTIEKVGYVTWSGSVEVPLAGAPAPPELAYTLDRKASASGKITRKGAPAAGVKVVVVRKDDGGGFNISPAVTTDAQGKWSVPDLESGNYFLKVGTGANNPFEEAGGTPFTIRGGQPTDLGAVEAP